MEHFPITLIGDPEHKAKQAEAVRRLTRQQPVATQPMNATKTKPDARYTIALEHAGHASPQHVTRFCGQWLAASATRDEAIQAARQHRAATLRTIRR